MGTVCQRVSQVQKGKNENEKLKQDHEYEYNNNNILIYSYNDIWTQRSWASPVIVVKVATEEAWMHRIKTLWSLWVLSTSQMAAEGHKTSQGSLSQESFGYWFYGAHYKMSEINQNSS